ncbi:MAG: HEPN domain-containing protein [Dehalococcoidia bacterium]|nr:HEPN domain-containing protein [Dehalococcoidia bacterium]
MATREDGGRWLEQSRDDLHWAEHLAGEGAHNIACFMSQQAAEKALKAFLYHSGHEIVLGHSVRDLCERVSQLRPELNAECERWGSLDAYYVPTRYPDALPGSIPSRVFDRAAADGTVAIARDVIETMGRLMAT